MRRRTLLLLILLGLGWTFAGAELTGVKILPKEKQIEIAGFVSKQLDRYQEELKGAIEYLACSVGGKEYESLLVLKASPQAIYDALIKLGAKPGKYASIDDQGKPVPPTGERLRLWVRWSQHGKPKRVRAETLVVSRKTHKPLKPMEWVFTGSRWTWPLDEESDEKVLEATIMKNIVGLLYADSSVLIQNPLPEAAEDNLYEKNADLLPPPGTPVTLILEISPKKE